MMSLQTPLGVKVLSGLVVLTGALMLTGGVALMTLASEIPLVLLPPEQMPMMPTAVTVVGGVLVAIGAASIAVAAGLYKGRSRAWRAMIVIAFIGIGIAAVSVAMGNVAEIASVLINGAILYYLYRPNVKAYFGGKAPVAQQSRRHISFFNF